MMRWEREERKRKREKERFNQVISSLPCHLSLCLVPVSVLKLQKRKQERPLLARRLWTVQKSVLSFFFFFTFLSFALVLSSLALLEVEFLLLLLPASPHGCFFFRGSQFDDDDDGYPGIHFILQLSRLSPSLCLSVSLSVSHPRHAPWFSARFSFSSAPLPDPIHSPVDRRKYILYFFFFWLLKSNLAVRT